MTWLKLADEFPKECRRARLSDAAFRVHVEGLCFAMDDENDGIIYEDDLRSFTRAADPMAAVQELCDCSFWLQLGPAKWQIMHQMEHQPDAETLTARRKLAAERQARKRRKAAGLADVPEQRSGPLYPRDTPSDDPRDPVRSGSVRDWESQQTNPALEEKAEHSPPPCGVDLTTGVLSEPGPYKPCTECGSTSGTCRCFDEPEVGTCGWCGPDSVCDCPGGPGPRPPALARQ